MTFNYFKTESAVYSIYNGTHYIHLKQWDKIAGFKYHWAEITVSKYVRAWREAVNA